MKKEELVEIGLTEEQIQKVFVINGKDIEAKKTEIAAKLADIAKLEGERDNFKSLYETADKALKRFDGIDPEKLQQEIQTSKDALEQAKKNFEKQLASRDQNDWLSKKLDEYGIASPYARKQLEAEIKSEENGLPWRDGAFFGFDDYMAAAKKKDPTLYQTEEEKAAAEKDRETEESAPAFTGPTGNGESDGGRKYVPPKIF